jgi:hypothetical protein
MRSNAPRMHVVKKEDKEAKVRDFIRQEMVAATARGGVAGPFCLMALSEDSPVARALASLAGDLQTAGISVRAVFAETGVNASSTMEAAKGLERVAIARRAPDARLLDAHEQLILSDTSVWVGDCMRRDPSKRDAYETHANDSAETVVWAKRSFEQFWSKGKPVRLGAPVTTMPVGASEVVPGEGSLATAGGDFTPAVGATRH